MTSETASSPTRRPATSGQIHLTWFQGAALIVLALTIGRLLVNGLSELNLGPDEAQYWSWSKDFAFGYFSKPPMLAWVIGLTTSVCGDTEACIRASSPLLHAGTSLMLFALGAALFGPRTGFWSAVAFATLPAVSFSAGIASTDVPLLFFWSIALYGLWRTIGQDGAQTPGGLGWTMLTGVALGLGFMSKYAMLYFLLGTGLFLLVDAQARAALLGWRGLVILALTGAILAPNLAWNAANDFATVSHTAANASWGGTLFNPDKMLKFVGDQFGVFGPILFTALLWGLITLRTRLAQSPRPRALVYLLVFAIPPILIVTGQAFISRANANWAATAYVAATVLTVSWLLAARAAPWLKGSVVLHTLAGLFLSALVLSPSLVEALGRGNDFKRVRAWDEIGAAVNTIASQGHQGRPFTSVLVNDRLVFGEMLYYAHPLPVELTMWDTNGIPENHFELNNPLTPELGAHTLFVTRSRNPERVLMRFRRSTLLTTFVSPIGAGRERRFTFYVLEGYLPQAPGDQP